MRVALTGASGFVGRYVLRELVSHGLDIVVTTHGQPLVGATPSVHEVPLDIHGPGPDPFATLGRPDLLLHLAWSGLPAYASCHHVEEELPAQISFLTACVRTGVKRVVVVGTCFEYGLASGELNEDQTLAPVTGYGEAKARLYEYMLALRTSVPFEFAWPRLFYLYGSGQSSRSLYSQLQSAIARGDGAFDMSGGEQIRDYLPIAEAARLLVGVAVRAGDAGAVNVCSGAPVKLKDQVAKWINAAGSTMHMNLGRFPYPDFEPMAFWGSRNKLDHVLGIT